jgi:hypothetical protein
MTFVKIAVNANPITSNIHRLVTKDSKRSLEFNMSAASSCFWFAAIASNCTLISKAGWGCFGTELGIGDIPFFATTNS